MIKNLVFFLFLINSSAYAAYTDSFILDVLNDCFRVSSPKQWEEDQHLILNNKTLIDYRFKIETEGRKNRFITLFSGERKSIKLSNKKNARAALVPMSPPGQKINFNISEKPYEIPETK